MFLSDDFLVRIYKFLNEPRMEVTEREWETDWSSDDGNDDDDDDGEECIVGMYRPPGGRS